MIRCAVVAPALVVLASLFQAVAVVVAVVADSVPYELDGRNVGRGGFDTGFDVRDDREQVVY